MDIAPVILNLLSSNRSPDPLSPGNRTLPDYGVHAALEADDLRIVLKFNSEAAYCCMEWGCHLPLHNGKRWKTLRKKCADYGVSTPVQFQLHLSCVVESGTLFFDVSRPDATLRGWYAFRSAEAYQYEVTSLEACDRPAIWQPIHPNDSGTR